MADDILDEIQKNREHKQYEEYVKTITPSHNIWVQMLRAFCVGGLFCAFGELLMKIFGETMMMDKIKASHYTVLVLVLLGAALTGLNIYQKIARFGGAGALVPITGFANAVAAPAIEHRTEGHIFGIGCKIFSIAGPVILFGILTSWGLGILYWIFVSLP